MGESKKTEQPSGNALVRAWNSRGTGIAAAVIVGAAFLAVAASVVVGVVAPVGADRAAPSGAAHPSATPRASAAADDGRCRVPAGDQSSVAAAPSDIRWVAGDAGVSWPASATVGPTRTRDGFGVCFARSPLGAALAASTELHAQWSSSPADALEFYVADGPGKRALVDAARGGESSAAQMRDAGVSTVGFRVNSYTKDRAVITLVFSASTTDTGYVGAPLTVVWTGGDWRLAVLDDGNLFAGSPVTPAEGQFTPWVTR